MAEDKRCVALDFKNQGNLIKSNPKIKNKNVKINIFNIILLFAFCFLIFSDKIAKTFSTSNPPIKKKAGTVVKMYLSCKFTACLVPSNKLIVKSKNKRRIFLSAKSLILN